LVVGLVVIEGATRCWWFAVCVVVREIVGGWCVGARVRCCLGWWCWMELEVLKINYTITSLDFISNSIGTQGATVISECLKINHTVDFRPIFDRPDLVRSKDRLRPILTGSTDSTSQSPVPSGSRPVKDRFDRLKRPVLPGGTDPRSLVPPNPNPS
jgi:hypothetical protein